MKYMVIHSKVRIIYHILLIILTWHVHLFKSDVMVIAQVISVTRKQPHQPLIHRDGSEQGIFATLIMMDIFSLLIG